MTGLILASASSVRARVLQSAGVAFEIEPANVDEDSLKDSLLASGASLAQLADSLAEAKALRISTNHPEAFVLGADQVLDFDGALVNKCASLAEAKILLRRLQGKEHRLISALVLAKGGQPLWRHSEAVRLQMRALSDSFLDAYLAAEGEDLLKGVGCYRLEGRGSQLFTRIEGDYFAVLGLPLLPLLAILRAQGVIAS